MVVRATFRAETPEDLEIHLEAVVRRNVLQLRRGLCPPLYASGARYRREPRGHEVWQTAVEVYRSGHGDCEDLACYLAASHRLVGVGSKVRVLDIRPGLKHVVVALPDDSIEDPSKKLGMKGRG